MTITSEEKFALDHTPQHPNITEIFTYQHAPSTLFICLESILTFLMLVFIYRNKNKTQHISIYFFLMMINLILTNKFIFDLASAPDAFDYFWVLYFIITGFSLMHIAYVDRQKDNSY